MNKTNDNEMLLQPTHVSAYNFVKKYIEKNVTSPTTEEISAGIKITLRHTHRIVNDLIKLGYFSKEHYKKRSIQILKPLR